VIWKRTITQPPVIFWAYPLFFLLFKHRKLSLSRFEICIKTKALVLQRG
jgi:hypothetical protein